MVDSFWFPLFSQPQNGGGSFMCHPPHVSMGHAALESRFFGFVDLLGIGHIFSRHACSCGFVAFDKHMTYELPRGSLTQMPSGFPWEQKNRHPFLVGKGVLRK